LLFADFRFPAAALVLALCHSKLRRRRCRPTIPAALELRRFELRPALEPALREIYFRQDWL
jgi:hypothetical protein